MARFRTILLGAPVMLPCALPLAASDYVPGEGRVCERGKGIERTLGMHGYRVVVAGSAREERAGGPVVGMDSCPVAPLRRDW